MASRGAIRSGLGSIADTILAKKKQQALIDAAELKRQRELEDRESLALNIEQALGISTPAETPSLVEPATVPNVPADGIIEQDTLEDGSLAPTASMASERRAPGRNQRFTFTPAQRKAFSRAVAIDPSSAGPILNFLSKSNEFDLQQLNKKNARNLRGALFLKEAKTGLGFQKRIRELVQSGLYGQNEVKQLIDLSNETDQAVRDLKVQKIILDSTDRKTLIEEETKKRAEAAKPLTLSSGQRAFTRSGQEIARGAPKFVTLSNLEKNARAAGHIPGTPEFEKFIAQNVSKVKPPANFEFVVDPEGNKIAQRNTVTGEIKKLPKSFGSGGGQAEKATFTKSPGVLLELPDGTFAQAIPVLDTRTGEVVNKLSPIPGQPVSRIGETGEELTARKIKQAGGITRTKAQQTRLQTDIDDGISAAKGMAVVRRSMGLLDSVKTGGIDAAILRAKQLFGVESANEAELSANMGKQVMAQLRPIFGAQFTEREGATLARIEAGFGKSVKGNIRLLNQAKQLIQRAGKRGIAAAVETEDFRTAQDIKDLLEFALEEEAPLTQIETPAQIEAPVVTTEPEGIPAPPPGFVVQ